MGHHHHHHHHHDRWAQAYGLGLDDVLRFLLGPLGGLLGFGQGGTQPQLAERLNTMVEDWIMERRRHDQYVVPGVHWDAFSHPVLYEMVHEYASPPQVDKLADDWARHGRELTQRAEDLQRSLAALLPFWRGEASERAARSVIDAVGWMGDVGATTTAMNSPLQDSSGALRSAQATMPPPPDTEWLAATGAGAATGFAAAGPVGAGVGAAMGGITSAYAAGVAETQLKRRAVQTMQRYEAAAVQVDTTTPQFVDSGVRRIGMAEYEAWRMGGPPPTIGTAPVPDTTVPAGAPPGTVGAGPGGSGPSALGGRIGPGGVGWHDLTGRAGPNGFLGAAGIGAGGPSAGAAGMGGGGFAGGGAGVGMGAPYAGRGGAGGEINRPGAFGPGGRYGSGMGTVPGGGYGPAAAMGYDDDHAGRRGATAHGAAGGAAASPLMPGGAAGGEGSDDYRRRYPYEEQPFKLDDEVAPPVIGA